MSASFGWLMAPAGAVSGDFEPMRDAQMTAECLCAMPAFQANDVILLYRAADRHCRLRRFLHAPETGKRSMHLDDQSRELPGGDLVMPHVAADNVCDLIEIDPWRRILFGHLCAP